MRPLVPRRATKAPELQSILIFVLFASIFLIFARPVLSIYLREYSLGTGLDASYGILTSWDRGPLPDNSIGFDFICQEVHVRCAGAGKAIYTASCPGDPGRRLYVYPPLMAFLTLWVRWFSTPDAIATACLAVLAGVFICSFWMLRIGEKMCSGDSDRPRNIRAAVTASLLMLSYPSIFAFERGSNDILLLWGFAVAWFLCWKRHWFWVGAVLSILVALKIYPVTVAGAFSVAAVCLCALGLIRKEQAVKKLGMDILAGQFMGVTAIAVFFWNEYAFYLTRLNETVLQRIGKAYPIWDRMINHSLKTVGGEAGLAIGLLLWLVSTAALCRFLYRMAGNPSADTHQKVFISFGYLVLLSVYLTSTNSYDYNLILSIPLLCALCTLSGPERSNSMLRLSMWLLCIGIFTPRWLEYALLKTVPEYYSIFFPIQVAGLTCLAIEQGRMALLKKDRR